MYINEQKLFDKKGYYPLYIRTNADTNAPFTFTRWTDNTSGPDDAQFRIGYNTAVGGGRIVNDEPALYTTWESNWKYGASYYTEFHHNMTWEDGVNVRPYFFMCNRDTANKHIEQWYKASLIKLENPFGSGLITHYFDGGYSRFEGMIVEMKDGAKIEDSLSVGGGTAMKKFWVASDTLWFETAAGDTFYAMKK